MNNILKSLVLSLFCSCFVYSQHPNIKFEHISVDQGLSNNIVYSIIQDSQGFMWFATSNVLNKYDGYKFTIYRREFKNLTTIGSNNTYTLLEDKRGILWVGTVAGGLNKMDISTQKFKYHIPSEKEGWPYSWITTVEVDSSGMVWGR